MRKLGNKGFAISGIVYSVLILFVLLITSILAVLSNRKVILDKAKKDVVSRIDNQENNEKLSVDDYSKYGLIIHYDGIKNTRSGEHNSNATRWENLVSSGTNDGILTNFPANSFTGGNGLSFNGSSYVNMGSLNLGNSSVTFQVVVGYTNNKVTSTLIGNLNEGGYSLDHQYNPYIDWNYEAEYANHIMSFYNPTLSSTQALASANETKSNYVYSLTGILNKEEKKILLFENGSQFESIVSSLDLDSPKNNTNLTLGAKVVGSNIENYLRGKIYSVRVYNRALTSYEVYKNYSVDRSRFELTE